jgi:hypothetical protein
MFDDLHPLSCDPLTLYGFFDDGDDPAVPLANLKSIIAARAHEFCFDYEFVQHLIRSRISIGSRPLEDVSRMEFLQLLEFREDEIRRVMHGGDPSWKWPAAWTPSWNNHVHNCVGPDMDLALAQTIQAQSVQKSLLGHGSRIALDWPVNMRVGTLVGILLDSPHFAPIPEPPLLLSSYDRPPSVSSEHKWDFDNILGDYRRPERIFLHERALTACSEALSIDRRLLRAIVILHECAHYFVDRLPSPGASPFVDRPNLPARVGWIDSGYAKTSVEVHETIAQILTFWACQDSWLRDTFDALNANQSFAYRRFKDDLGAGANPSTVVAAIAHVRNLSAGADVNAWNAALGV